MSSKYEYCHVIAGFPGIGKSTVAREYAENKITRFLDFDSAVFKANNVNHVLKEFDIETGEFVTIDNFPYAYVSEIHRIMEKYEKKAKNEKNPYKLFIMCSTHDTVLEQLHKMEIPHTIVIPGYSITARDSFVKRLTERYNDSVRTGKPAEIQEANKRALAAVEEHYYEYVADIRDKDISPYAQLVVLGDKEYLNDYVRSVVVGDIVGNLFKSVVSIPHLSPKDVQKALLERDNLFHYMVGSHGEVILYTDPVPRDVYDMPEINTITRALDRVVGFQSENSAFAGSPYVMISKDTARGVIDCCNLAIRKLRSGTREDDDVEVFGDLALHYERLIDAVDGLNYVYWHANRLKNGKTVEKCGDGAKVKVEESNIKILI